MDIKVRVTKDGDLLVISAVDLNITTQGRTMEEAKANLVEAITLCLEDSDWRESHNIQSKEKTEFRSEEKMPIIDWEAICCGKNYRTSLVLPS